MVHPEVIVTVLLALLSSVASSAAPHSGLEGHWTNPRHSTVVNVTQCGDGSEYCAVVVQASQKTQANAAKGGTTHFIGTEILRVHPAGEDAFEGTAFDPETNMHVSATVRLVGPGIMEMKGCAMMGLICQSQRWTKVEGSTAKRKRRSRSF
jgi:uncharacterized protein (DUF2147 family)